MFAGLTCHLRRTAKGREGPKIGSHYGATSLILVALLCFSFVLLLNNPRFFFMWGRFIPCWQREALLD